MLILFVLEVLEVIFAFYLAWICINKVKHFPRGILEWVIWIVAVAIIVSWGADIISTNG